MKAIFITVRTGSKRFPQKCLQLVAGKRAIERTIARAQQSKETDIIVLCTIRLPDDDILQEIAIKNGVYCFRGNEHDVPDRWIEAVKHFGVHFFVSFDGEDLLCCPELADLAFKQYENHRCEAIEAKNVPTGAFTFAFSRVGLEESIKAVPLEGVPKAVQRPEIRMTMDYPDDLLFFDNLYNNVENPTLHNVVEYLDKHPHVVLLNKHCQDLYLANQKQGV